MSEFRDHGNRRHKGDNHQDNQTGRRDNGDPGKTFNDLLAELMIANTRLLLENSPLVKVLAGASTDSQKSTSESTNHFV